MFSIYCFVGCFETGFLYEALAVLELTLQINQIGFKFRWAETSYKQLLGDLWQLGPLEAEPICEELHRPGSTPSPPQISLRALTVHSQTRGQALLFRKKTPDPTTLESFPHPTPCKETLYKIVFCPVL